MPQLVLFENDSEKFWEDRCVESVWNRLTLTVLSSCSAIISSTQVSKFTHVENPNSSMQFPRLNMIDMQKDPINISFLTVVDAFLTHRVILCATLLLAAKVTSEVSTPYFSTHLLML